MSMSMVIFVFKPVKNACIAMVLFNVVLTRQGLSGSEIPVGVKHAGYKNISGTSVIKFI